MAETKHFYYEDNFATLPQLTITWPTVPSYHEDSYPLEVLVRYLSEGKKAPFNTVLVDDKQLTSNVTMFQNNSELAGQYQIIVRGFKDVNLNDINKSITQAFAKFEAEGISKKDLDKIKAGQETSFYNRLSSVLGKGFQLAQYKIFAGDPGFINQDVKKILAVTTEDVYRVYKKYIKDKNYITTSFVPKGQVNLVLENAVLADVKEEKIIDGAEEEFDASIAATYQKTPSSFDRTIEPEYGESPDVIVPEVWESELSSGMKIYGIENYEVPLVQFTLNIKGGLLLENTSKIGVSNLLAKLLTKGTVNKTTAELENAIESLGANLFVFASDETITISGNTLARNYDKTMALVEEVLLEPRWDSTEFNLIKQSVISEIQEQKANPNSIAANEYAKLIYGKEHILSHNNLGTEVSLAAITLSDLKNYYNSYIAPNIAKLHVVGAISEEKVSHSLSSLNKKWNAKEIVFPSIPEVKRPEQSKIYFYDIPGAKQSSIRFGYPALAATDNDFYPSIIMNYRLGGGGFASQLTQQLRESKGYTYGIGSNFSGSTIPGPFTISSEVRSNITYESTSLVIEILNNYGENYTVKDLEVTQSFLIKSNARAFETMRSKLNMLTDISSLNYPKDYAKQRETMVKEMTLEKIKKLSKTYLNPDKMIYLVVGDAETQLKKLEELEYGIPTLLNPIE